MSEIILAIVGSTKFADDLTAAIKAQDYICDAIENLDPDRIISGGAIGIDTLAKELARIYCIEFKEYTPKNQRWAPDGFKQRNELMAQDCTHLLRIAHHASKTYGSGWTADLAESLGKEVVRHVI